MAKNEKSGELISGKSHGLINEKEKGILLQLKQNPEGLRVNTIHKLTGIPSRTIYRILKKYHKKSLVENIYPLWKRRNGLSDFWQSLSKSSEIFELHNLSYSIKLIKKPEWWNKRKSRLMRLKGWQFSNHNFGKNNSNPFQQMLNEDYVIQTYPESITVIHRKRYYSDNPYEVIERGIEETINLIKFLEQRFKFDFFPSGIPCIELRSNHYNRIKDHLAEKCKKEGNKFLVKTKVGNCWVDNSEPFGKESDTPDIQDTLEKVTKDHIENKPLLNSELQALVSQTATQINQVTQNQAMFAKNFETHVEAIQTLSQKVKELSEVINKLNESK
jgi:hypothetical protein